MKYRKEVDGLRALAIVPVVLYHAGFASFGGGFVGVDVFFVISGYLITSLLVNEFNEDRFSLIRFYERRSRRILPALYLVMACSSLAALTFLLPEERQDFFQGVAAVPIFASNILFWLKSGYFDTGAELTPLLHTWSLAVEEQYYIVFPLFMLVAWRLGRRLLTGLVVAVAALSLILAELGTRDTPSAAFFLLPTRAWEIAVGAVVALLSTRTSATKSIEIPSVVREFAGLTGLMLIIGSVMFYSHATPFPGVYALAPTIGTALIVAFASPQELAGRILGHPVLVGIGLISYSTYLWHQPLFAFTRNLSLSPPGPMLMSLLTALSFVLGYASWRFVEAPFRDRTRVSRRTIFTLAAVTSIGFISLGLGGHLSQGFASTFQNSLDERQRGILVTPRGVMVDDGACRFFSNQPDQSTRERFTRCGAEGTKAVVVIGDSHGMNLYNALASNLHSGFVLGLARPGCRPYSIDDECNYDEFAAFIVENRSMIAFVVYNQAGFTLIADDEGAPATTAMFRTVPLPVYTADSTFVDRVIDYLRPIGVHVPLIWLGPWMEPHLNAQHLKRLALSCSPDAPAVHPNVVQTFAGMDSFLVRRTASQSAFKYLSAQQVIGFDSRTDLYDCEAVYWRDTDHWSVKGVQRFGRRLAPVLVDRARLSEVVSLP